ncbi:MAG: hypothetical protein D6785_04735 [Planctomycetota bacterium]|nr:MAG: hypothetical protein D6785_04735 [Planctomycetota bacterium]
MSVNLKKLVRKRLGELLISEGVLNQEQVQEALKVQQDTGDLLGEILVQKGFASEMDIAQALCNYFQIPFLHPGQYDIPKDILGIMPASFLHEHQILPIDKFGNLVTAVISGIISREALEEFRSTTGCDLAVMIGTISEVKNNLRKLLPYGYDIDRKTKRLTKKLKKKSEEAETSGKGTAEGGRKVTLNKDYLMVKIAKKTPREEATSQEPVEQPFYEEEVIDPSEKTVQIEVTSDVDMEEMEALDFTSEMEDDWLSMFEEADEEIEMEFQQKQATGEFPAMPELGAASGGDTSAPVGEEGAGGDEDWGAMFDAADQQVHENVGVGLPGEATEELPKINTASLPPSEEGDWGSMFDAADQQVQANLQGMQPGAANPSPPTSPPLESSPQNITEEEGDWGSMFDAADQQVQKHLKENEGQEEEG